MHVSSKHRSLTALQLQSETCRLKAERGVDLGNAGRISRLCAATWRPKTCQWIEGEPKGRVFCDRPLTTLNDDPSYCDEHHKLCYVKAKPKTDGVGE